ncbi:MAG: translation initiation factor IF-2 [Lachnospiraceae bacterium]|nr:translation initiation factor IF-2 [Lachnospiraceae bacterium]
MTVSQFAKKLSEELGKEIKYQVVVEALADKKPGLKHNNGIDDELMAYAKEIIIKGKKVSDKEAVMSTSKKEVKKEEAKPAPKKEVKKEEAKPAPKKEVKKEEVKPAPKKEVKKEEANPAPKKEVKKEEVKPAPKKEVKKEEAKPAPKKNDKKQQDNKPKNNQSQNNGGNQKQADAGKRVTKFFNQPNNKKKNQNNQNNKNNKNQNQAQPEQPKKQEPVEPVIKTLQLPESLTVSELASKIKVPVAQLIKKMFMAGKMYNVNSELDFDTAADIALEYNYISEPEEKVDVIEEILREDAEDESLMTPRPPVVCVMGHVDHGKTSLLDAIRNSDVTAGEAGGITQHIGASVVKINGEKITFLDTPGHEAFTAMRMRGAQSTDIAILVVAADDGVMPQTVEAINHAKAAGIEIIVAINKIDKESANVDRVKQELMEHELVPEDWGGSTIFCPVSARTKEGIDNLLEMVILTAEILELKANKKRKARGIVIEAQLDKGRGSVATVLVQKGTLRVGDCVAMGSVHGKVRAMFDDKHRKVKEAGPSTPVEILGLNGVPNSGEIFMQTANEKEARQISEAFITRGKEKLIADTRSRMSLDDLFNKMQEGNLKELNLIIKADVQGSVEAVKASLLKLSNDEVVVKCIHSGVGAINESDVILASASNAIIIGFNIRPDNQAKDVADREKVDIRLYRVIYNAIEDIEAAMKGMLDPIFEEKVIGHAEVRQTYKASGVGTIAGSYVLDGTIQRNAKVRISREGEQIFEGALASLKRFKDDVKEVKTGYECGLVFEGFNDLKEFDIIEAYIMQEVPRK